MSLRRALRRALLLALLSGCYGNITLPECEAVTDCPACQGWHSCQRGYCFRSGADAPGWDSAQCAPDCTQQTAATPNAPDGCCPGRALDAALDPDCAALRLSVPDATAISPPALSGTTILVTVATATGLELVAIQSGAIAHRTPLPHTTDALPLSPVITLDGDALIASPHGLCRVAANGTLTWACDRGAPMALPPLALPNGDLILVTQEPALMRLTPDGAVAQTIALDPLPTSLIGTASLIFLGGPTGVEKRTTDTLALQWRADQAIPETPLSLTDSGTVTFGDQLGRLRVLRDKGAQYAVGDDDVQGGVYSEVLSTADDRVIATTPTGPPYIARLTTTIQPLAVSPLAEPTFGPSLLLNNNTLLLTSETSLWLLDLDASPIVPLWRFNGLAPSQTTVGVTALPNGTLVVTRSPDTVLSVPYGQSGPAAQGWIRHRRDARASALRP